MKPKRPRMSGRKTYYLVLWWMSQTPYAAIFENQVAAEAAANVRNALLVTISGRDIKVDQVLDWYRRDDSGRPMPAEWRDLVGQIHVPWLAKPKLALLSPPRAGTAPSRQGPSPPGRCPNAFYPSSMGPRSFLSIRIGGT